MKKLLIFLFSVILIIVITFLVGYKLGYFNENSVFYQTVNAFKDEETIKKQEYMNCMSKPYASSTLDDEFNNAFEELKKSGVAIYFKDINNDYVWNMNSTKVYYSASTSKLFEVIYLVEEARKGNIDLNSTLVYKPSDAMQGSIGMKKHKYYDEVSLSELIDHLLTYSDNTAHFMLIKYIGLDTLKEYFSDFNLVMVSEDPFVRNYTALMASKCLERLYSVLEVDDDYSALIKKAMNNKNMNYLSFDDKIIYHKYGMYDASFHDIGIYDSNNPYIIVVLTLYGNLGQDVFGPKVQNISKKVYEIYSKNLELKEEYCQSVLENN